MQIDLTPGKYVIAVSGGVDSMVLLDVLRQKPGLTLIVAHFEHGIREDSDEDRKLVESTAKKYGLVFVYHHGDLGKGTSEATARKARYTFLRRVRDHHGADAIITAHHQDDLIETAVLNLLRGTGRKGLSSLNSGDGMLRPLLGVPKKELLDYAAAHHIVWHEDSTNSSDQYLRNYVRMHVIPRLGAEGRATLLSYIEKAARVNPLIDSLMLEELRTHSVTDTTTLDRHWFVMLPYDVSCEAMTVWLRNHDVREFDKKMIERLVVACKVAISGKTFDVDAERLLKVGKTTLQLLSRITSSKQMNSV